MVRPRKIKKILFQPEITYFKPQGVPLRDLEEVELTLDELESLRLANCEELSQKESAEIMEIHQSTFQRTLTRAMKKLTDALINGKAIKIQGGDFKMPNGDRTGPEGKGPRTGRGLGRCSGSEEPGWKSEEKPRLGLGRRVNNTNVEPRKGIGRGEGQGLGRRDGRGNGRGRGLGLSRGRN